MPYQTLSRSVTARTTVLLWLLAGGALAALTTVAVVAWRAADRQRRDGEAALREAAGEAAAVRAAELEDLILKARSPADPRHHAPVKRAWFTQSGAPDDWIFGPWPQADSDSAGTTASGLPPQPLAIRKAMGVEGGDRMALAAQLLLAAVEYPSPLSTAFFNEAAAELANSSEGAAVPDIALLKRRLHHQERLRAALRECRAAIGYGVAWIETGRKDRWHLSYESSDDSIHALSADQLSEIATGAGFGQEGMPSLPAGWMFQAELDGTNLQELTHSTGGLMASRSRGPLTVLAVAFPPDAFAALDSQQLRQRWLIAGATGFMTLAGAGFLFVLARQRRLNAMMSNFVAAVSHELRAPVGSMGLLAERLSDGRAGSSGEEAHYHRLLRDECRRLAATIGNVLTFSRRQRGLMGIESELSDLTALLRDAADLMRPQAEERGVILFTDYPDESVERELDPGIIRQAVLNLLDNALKFSPPGGTVHIRLREEEGGAVITVRDEGPGIPAAERTRIFQPFYRTGSELRRETPGIGIGLAIVHAAALAHGGSITAGAAPGRGAEFTLRLGTVPPPVS